MSVMEPVSHEMHNVGHRLLQSNYATDMNEYTKEGNNKVINARIFTMHSNHTSILHIDRLWYPCWGLVQITKNLFPTEPRIAQIYLSSNAVTINWRSVTYPRRPIMGIMLPHKRWRWRRRSRPQGREDLDVTTPWRLAPWRQCDGTGAMT
jgi:hypothetical protein